MTDMDRGKDYEPDIYATHEEDYDDFDVEEEEEGGSRAAIILIVVIGAVILLGSNFVTYRVAFQNGQREASVPHLQAAKGGKEQPENPGGMQAPQESELDDAVTGGSENEFAQLLPREEEVVPPENKGGSEGSPAPEIDIPTIGVDPDTESLEPDDSPDRVPVEAPNRPKPQARQPKPQRIEVDPQPAPDTSSSSPGRIMVPKPGASVPSPSAGSSGTGSPKPAHIPAPSTKIPAPPAQIPAPSVSGPAPSAGMSGDYVVQLASLPSEEAADSAWRTTTAKFPDLLDGAIRDVQKADLGDKGIFYRLRVGYFENRSEANRLCDSLKSRGQDCLVVTR